MKQQDSIEGATSSLLTSSAASLNRPSFAAPYRPPFADDEAYREHNELILLHCMHDFAGNTNHPLHATTILNLSPD